MGLATLLWDMRIRIWLLSSPLVLPLTLKSISSASSSCPLFSRLLSAPLVYTVLAFFAAGLSPPSCPPLPPLDEDEDEDEEELSEDTTARPPLDGSAAADDADDDADKEREEEDEGASEEGDWRRSGGMCSLPMVAGPNWSAKTLPQRSASAAKLLSRSSLPCKLTGSSSSSDARRNRPSASDAPFT